MSIVVHRIAHPENQRPGDPEPNLVDYPTVYREFSYDAALAAMSSPPARGLNIGFEAVDRQALNFRNEQVAVRWLSSGGSRLDLTYGELAMLSSRLANVLDELGVHPGQVVCTWLGRVPTLYAIAIGTLKHRAVFAPLSPSLTTPELVQHLVAAGARVLFTTRRQYRAQLESVRAAIPALEHVVLIDDDAGLHAIPATLAYVGLMRNASAVYAPIETRAEDLALLHFDGGRDAPALPIAHPHAAYVLHQTSGHYALDLHPGDIFLPVLDPGTLFGTVCGIIAPLANRATVVLDHAPFRAERCYGVLADERVQVLCAEKAAIEDLGRAGSDAVQGRDLSALRLAACSGDPGEAAAPVERALGRPLHLNLFEPYFGAIVLANFPGLPVQRGAVGRPVPGIEAALVRDRGGTCERVDQGEGELLLRTFAAHGGQSRWFATGRRARRDAAGDYWLRS